MKNLDFYTDHEGLRGRIAQFMRERGIKHSVVAQMVTDATGMTIAYNDIWNAVNGGSASYERMDVIARVLRSIGFDYEPLPDADSVVADVAFYLKSNRISKISVVRHGIRTGAFPPTVDGYRQFRSRNHRILHRVVRVIEGMKP
jgi:hypothetical protein